MTVVESFFLIALCIVKVEPISHHFVFSSGGIKENTNSNNNKKQARSFFYCSKHINET